MFQSTHPSGVRRAISPVGFTTLVFQSTHPSGVRLAKVEGTSLTYSFQSTHPSGVRLHESTVPLPQQGFNPRTPVGCDHIPGHGTFSYPVSIHAPQWGATGHIALRRGPYGVSIHAPQWGATARMGIAFHNMEAPSVLKTDFIAKIHVHRSIHKFSNQKHQQTIHF